MKFNRRVGISPIIAVLLLILIAIAAGVMVYAFVAGWVGSATSSTTVVQAQLSIDFVDANSTSQNITVYVRNVGGSSAIIDSIYVTQSGGGEVAWDSVTEVTGPGIYGDTTTYPETYGNLTISPGGVIGIVIRFSSGTLEEGVIYTVRFVASDGSVFMASVRAHS